MFLKQQSESQTIGYLSRTTGTCPKCPVNQSSKKMLETWHFPRVLNLWSSTVTGTVEINLQHRTLFLIKTSIFNHTTTCATPAEKPFFCRKFITNRLEGTCRMKIKKTICITLSNSHFKNSSCKTSIVFHVSPQWAILQEPQ